MQWFRNLADQIRARNRGEMQANGGDRSTLLSDVSIFTGVVDIAIRYCDSCNSNNVKLIMILGKILG